jgi:hypothetical protein
MREGNGDAPVYPDWVYRLVILPRLLWQEQQRTAQIAANVRRNEPAQQRPQSEPFDGHAGDRTFDGAFDFEWWLDEDADNRFSERTT